MPSIADLRAANPWADDISDIELLNLRADQVGVSIQDAAHAFGYDLPKSNTSANLKSGGHGYLAGLGSLGAAVGLPGAQEFADSHRTQSELYDSLSTAPKTFDEVQGFSDFLGYAGRLGAQSLPYAAEFAATAGLGGLAMRGTRAAISAAEAAGDVTAATAGRAALSRGATAAGVAGSYPSALGDVLSNQYEQSGQYDLGYAAAAGVPYAALNAVGIEGLATRGLTRGLGKGLTNSRLANAGIMGGVVGASEGLSETGQEVFNQYGRHVVDPNYDPFGDEAQLAYKESMIGGAILGGIPGGAGGFVQRKLSAGSNLLTGDNPTEDRIAVNPGAELGTQQWIDQLTGVSRGRPVNTQASFEAAMDAPIGVTGFDPATGQERQLTGADTLPQQVAPAQGQQAPAVDASITPDYIASKYGIEQVADNGDGTGHWKYFGKDYFKQDAVVDLVNKLAAKENEKPAPLRELEDALQQGGKPLAPARLNKLANEYFGTSLENTAGNLNARIQSLVEQGKGADNPELSRIASAYESLVGKEAPAYAATQKSVSQPVQKGVNATQPKQMATQAVQADATQVAATPADVNGLIQTDNEPKSFIDVLAAQGIELAPKQAAVVDYVENALRSNEADKVIDAEGVFKFAEIAKAMGVNRGSVAVPLNAIRDKIVAASGRSLEEIKAGLQSRAAKTRKVEAADATKLGMSPKQQNAKLEDDAVFGENASMQDINSVGGSVSDVGGKNEPLPESAKVETTLDQAIAAKNAELAQLEADKAFADLLADPEATIIAADFEAFFDLPMTALTPNEAAEFINRYNEVRAEAEDFNEVEQTLVQEFQEYVDAARTNGSQRLQDTQGTGREPRLEGNDGQVASLPASTGEGRLSESPVSPENKPTVSTKAKTKRRVAQNPESIWNELAAQYNLPQLNELDPQAQADWLMAKKHDLATANKVFEANQKYTAQLDQANPDSAGKRVSIRDAEQLDRDELAAKYPDVAKALSLYSELGIEHSLNAVDVWAVNDAMEASDGVYEPLPGGRQGIMFREGALTDEVADPEGIAHHEIAHALDLAGYGGVYSSQPEMLVSIQKGKLVPTGAVSREMFKLYNSNVYWKGALQYPFNHNSYEKLKSDSGRIRTELFAQLWAIYANPITRTALEHDAPITAKYLSEVLNDVRATKTFSSKTKATAERRAIGFAASRDPNWRDKLVSAEGVRQDAAGQDQTYEVAHNAAATFQAVGGETGARVVDDTGHLLKKGIHSLTFLHDLVAQYKGKLKSVQTWYDQMQQHQVARVRREREAEAIASMADKLSDTSYKKVNAFIGDSTFKQAWGYQPKWRDAVTLNPEMRARWKTLTASEQEVADAIFKHGFDTQQAKYDLLKKIGVPDLMVRPGKLDGPYAPLMRFGNFTAILKSQKLLDAEKAEDTKLVDELKADPQHYQVSMFDTLGQARGFVRKFGDGYAFNDAFENSERIDDQKTMDYKVLQKVMAYVKADQAMPREARQAMEGFVTDLYLNASAEHSARQQARKRNYRAGYDTDMVRAFLTSARANASFMANLEYGEKINESMLKMRNEVKSETGERVGQDAYNMFAQHYADNFKYKPTPFQDIAVGLTSAWQLSTSVGYHLTNATQGAMVTVPRLASDFNDYAGAWRHLMDGYKLFKQIAKGMTVDLSKIQNKNLRDALQYAADLGDLDVGMEENLGHFDRMRTGYKTLDTLSNIGATALHKLRSVSRMVETMNRVSAGAAAYNMAIAHGKSIAQAKDYVINVLKTTQGDFTRAGAPLALKKLPKVMTQYRKFQLMMAALYVKAFNQAFHGATAEERAIGKRMLMFKLFHTSMAAGVLGFPMMNLAIMAYAALGGDDEPWDLETDLRAAIGDKMVADLLLHGPGAMLGLDMSAKLGEDKIFSIMPYNDFDFSSGKKAMQTIGALVAGPAGSQAGRFIDGFNYIAQGDYYKGIEKLMPKGVATAMESFRLENEGYSLRNGDVIVKPEDISEFGLLLNALGLPSTMIMEMKRENAQHYEVSKFFDDRSGEIKREYMKAAKDKDTEEMSDLRKQWMELQAAKDRQRKLLGGNRDFLKRQDLSTLLKYPERHAKAVKSKELNVKD